MKRFLVWLSAIAALLLSPVWARAAVLTPSTDPSSGQLTPLLPLKVYTVQPGDSLWTLCQKLGVPLEQLIADNDITDPRFLQPGQQLIYHDWARSELTTSQTADNVPGLEGATVLHCTLTAYTAGYESTGKTPGDPGYGITATGVPAQEGVTVAVDPHVIPYGSRLYIPGLGYRIAQDTGGAILGDHIDVFFNDVNTARAFGIKRDVPVYVLPPASH